MKRKIVIAGGTGALGSALIRNYYDTDTDVVVLTRNIKKAEKNVRYVAWDAKNLGSMDKRKVAPP